jgi:hypothetical protein
LPETKLFRIFEPLLADADHQGRAAQKYRDRDEQRRGEDTNV